MTDTNITPRDEAEAAAAVENATAAGSTLPEDKADKTGSEVTVEPKAEDAADVDATKESKDEAKSEEAA